MKPDNNTRQRRKLAGFYLHVATLIHKDVQHRVSLTKIAERYDRNTAYAWMQWADARQWFSANSGGVYCLKSHLLLMPLAEIYQSIKKFYRL